MPSRPLVGVRHVHRRAPTLSTQRGWHKYMQLTNARVHKAMVRGSRPNNATSDAKLWIRLGVGPTNFVINAGVASSGCTCCSASLSRTTAHKALCTGGPTGGNTRANQALALPAVWEATTSCWETAWRCVCGLSATVFCMCPPMPCSQSRCAEHA